MKNKVTKKEISNTYHRDCTLLALFAAFMWAIVTMVMFQAESLTSAPGAETIIFVISLTTGIGLTLGLFAVYRHLHNNEDPIYREDIANLKLIKEAEQLGFSDVRKIEQH